MTQWIGEQCPDNRPVTDEGGGPPWLVGTEPGREEIPQQDRARRPRWNAMADKIASDSICIVGVTVDGDRTMPRVSGAGIDSDRDADLPHRGVAPSGCPLLQRDG